MKEDLLRPHQRNALERMGNGKILWGGTGSGKSITAATYYMEREAPKDVYVFTTARKRDELDWEGEFVRYGVGTQVGASRAGLLTVDSWNNIDKYVNVEGAFFIFDEQRVVGSGAWVKAFIAITKKNNWILLSATPGDTWFDYCPVFIANGFYRNRSDFIEQHVEYVPRVTFPKVKRYHNLQKLAYLRDQILVEMPYDRHTNRHIIPVHVTYDELRYRKIWKQRWNIYEDKPIRDIAEMFRLARMLVNSDKSRVEAIRKLSEQHPRLIVFYNFDYELEFLREMAQDMECVVAEWNGHKHQPVPIGYDRWLYFVQYTAGSEAWNCVDTDAMVFYSLSYSYKVYSQAQGRIDRLNTGFIDLYYYVLLTNSPIDSAIRKALATKKDFNEAAYARRLTSRQETRTDDRTLAAA